MKKNYQIKFWLFDGTSKKKIALDYSNLKSATNKFYKLVYHYAGRVSGFVANIDNNNSKTLLHTLIQATYCNNVLKIF